MKMKVALPYDLDDAQFEAMDEGNYELAQELGVPQYVINQNKLLIEWFKTIGEKDSLNKLKDIHERGSELIEPYRHNINFTISFLTILITYLYNASDQDIDKARPLIRYLIRQGIDPSQDGEIGHHGDNPFSLANLTVTRDTNLYRIIYEEWRDYERDQIIKYIGALSSYLLRLQPNIPVEFFKRSVAESLRMKYCNNVQVRLGKLIGLAAYLRVPIEYRRGEDTIEIDRENLCQEIQKGISRMLI